MLVEYWLKAHANDEEPVFITKYADDGKIEYFHTSPAKYAMRRKTGLCLGALPIENVDLALTNMDTRGKIAIIAPDGKVAMCKSPDILREL